MLLFMKGSYSLWGVMDGPDAERRSKRHKPDGDSSDASANASAVDSTVTESPRTTEAGPIEDELLEELYELESSSS